MRNIVRFNLCIFLCGLFTISHGQSLDRIVAIANDTPITQTELNEAIASAKKQVEGTGIILPAENIMQKQVLQQLVDRKIEMQLADQTGIKVTDEQVGKAISHIAEGNNMTAEQLLEQVKHQGMTIEDYRKEIREEITIQELQQQQVGAKISISQQEVTDFLRSKPWQVSNNKEYHLEDIVVALPDEPTTQQIQDAKKQAEATLDKLHHGTNFHTAAMSDSSGAQALKGGDLGWRKLPEIPSAFAKDVMTMQTNDIAGPIQTSNGFHIIHLAGVRSTGKQDTSTKQVQQLIYQRKMEEAVQTWLAKIRSQAFINMNPEN
jgi:peptidyl-prolyl cis-trans isomerase SurA